MLKIFTLGTGKVEEKMPFQESQATFVCLSNGVPLERRGRNSIVFCL